MRDSIQARDQFNVTGAGSHRIYIFEDWENYTDFSNIITVSLCVEICDTIR
jgi:hypothetical protein